MFELLLIIIVIAIPILAVRAGGEPPKHQPYTYYPENDDVYDEDDSAIHSRIRGISFKNDDGACRQKLAKQHAKAGARLFFIREPKNKHDSNTIEIWVKSNHRLYQLGNMDAELAEDMAPYMDAGGKLEGKITEVTGGGDLHTGVNYRFKKL